MKRLLFLIALSLLSAGIYAEDFSSVYGNIGDLFQNPDQNTGLTVFPLLRIPLGGRYEGMGTAFTAVADDAGFLEANPSGSSGLAYTELSVLHNNWIADSNMEGVIYTVRFNDLGIGFGGKFLYVPFTEYNAWGERVSKGYYSESLATANISYNFFSSYYFYGLSVGTNLKVAYRNVPGVFYAPPEGATKEETKAYNQSALAVMLDVGVLTRFNVLKFFASRKRNFSLGAVVKNMGPNAKEEPLPAEATFGIAYAPIRPLIVAFDFNFPFSFNKADFPAEEWNIATGIDIVFTDFFSVQSGFRIRGSNPRISLGSTVDLEKVTFVVNYTLDMTTQFNAFDKFSIEAKFNLGDRGRGELTAKIDDFYTASLEEYADGNLEKAMSFLEDVMLLDPDFQPATELYKIIQRAIVLQREMESIQQVE